MYSNCPKNKIAPVLRSLENMGVILEKRILIILNHEHRLCIFILISYETLIFELLTTNLLY